MYPHYKDTSWVRRNSPQYEMPQLPPIEFARQLYQAQHAYIGTIFSGLLPEEFDERLTQLYSRQPDFQNKDECLEYCQILLIFAFGLMYSVNQWTSNDGPPGFDFFKCAIKLLPDVHEDGSLLFVETLNHVAYYMQTINRRDAAYLYVRPHQFFNLTADDVVDWTCTAHGNITRLTSRNFRSGNIRV
jgi:proline utilization trans-activator